MGGKGGLEEVNLFFYKESKSKFFFVLGVGGGGRESWGREWEARVREFFFAKFRGVGEGGLVSVNFFIKDPNLKKKNFFWGGGGGGVGEVAGEEGG